MKWLFPLSVSLILPRLVFAAACCGGGFAAPSLIVGDDKAQFSSSYSFTEVVVDSVDPDGIWRSWPDHQQLQILRLEGAHIFADRWQAGFALPLMQRQLPGEKSAGLGDIVLSLGYEYLPDWSYHPIRPKGIGFLQLVLPTGKSRAETENGGLDSRGNGFWALGAGTLLTKAIHRYDLVANLEVHRSFGKEVHSSLISSQGSARLEPGFGGSLMLGAGYNTDSWRLGPSLTWTYEDPVSLQESGRSRPGFVERYATATVTASYLASDEWSGSLSYADQTLFGSPVNTSLGRVVSIQLQRRFSR